MMKCPDGAKNGVFALSLTITIAQDRRTGDVRGSTVLDYA